MKISPELKKLFADKILDFSNIGAGALLFGQFLSGDKFSWPATVAGLTLIIAGLMISYFLYQGGDNK